MRLKVVAAAFAVIGAVAMLAAPAHAAPKKKVVTVVDARGHTVFTSRDEDGRTRTRVIIQKRSYLDPGTETFPGERRDNWYAELPNQRASGVIDNTVFGLSNTQSPLPGPYTLPGKNNPWLQF
jgi:hypothetical protein